MCFLKEILDVDFSNNLAYTQIYVLGFLSFLLMRTFDSIAYKVSSVKLLLRLTQ